MPDAADKVTREIVDWAKSVLPKIDVSTQPLEADAEARGVDVRLIALTPRQGARTNNPPLVINLDYLITVRLEDAYSEQNALTELLFAAIERHDFEIIAERPAVELCAELGAPVAAGFVIRKPLLREREARKVPRVREPLRVNYADLGVVEGAVFGPGDVPIANAIVSIPGFDGQTRTDAHGRFRIAGVPQLSGGIKFNVKARAVELDSKALPGQLVIVHLPLEV